jgi:hypothetical protein
VEAPKPVEIPAEVVQRERQVRAAQEKVAAERAELAKQRQEVEEWKAARAKEQDAKADPLEKIERAHSKLEKLEQSIQADKAAAELRAWQTAKVAEVKAGGDKYELTLLHGYEHLVPARIEAHWHRTGEMLSTDAVAEALEKELEAATEKSLASKKWKAKTAPAVTPAATAPPPATAKPVEKSPGRAAPQTLTNDLGGTQTTPAPAKKMSFEERKAATLAKWEALEQAKKAKAG